MRRIALSLAGVLLAAASFCCGIVWEAHHIPPPAPPAAHAPQVWECVGSQPRQYAPLTYACGWVAVPTSAP
jgi:hypothetical protein